MTTIDQIKQELRDIIELSDKATPGEWIVSKKGDSPLKFPGISTVDEEQDIVECHYAYEGGGVNGLNNASFIAASRNLTPKMARALLTIIEDLEERSKKQAFLPGSLNICTTAEAHTAFSQLETIRREWEGQA